MRLHDLKPAEGSRKARKRIGRGNASGQGTTAGKGTKGQKARSGGAKNGFRGMSSRNQRLAKRKGFTNVFKKQFEIVSVSSLASLPEDSVVNPITLAEANLVRPGATLVKILGNGDLQTRLRVEDVQVTAGARSKIEAAGGTIAAVPAAAASEESDDSSGT